MKNTERHPGKPTGKPVIYLDHNATTPVDPEVIAAMEPFFREHFGNPSSTHAFGAITRSAIEKARVQTARLLNARAHEIIFTSGGTESNNLAILGAAHALKDRGRHVITSAVEHPAVMEVCKSLQEQGFSLTILPVDGYGLVYADELRDAIRPDTILISVMHANNETGTIQPISELAAMAREKGIVFHTDAAQSVGKVPVDVQELGVDLLSVAGHKFYAPKGVGALYIREGTPIRKLLFGADHEQNRRPGTENVLQITGLGQACELASENLETYRGRMKETRDLLEDLLKDEFQDMRINGHPDLRLPNTLNVSFRNLEASVLLLSMEGVAASAGAACHSDEITVSPVLDAMGLSVEWSMGSIRFSTGRQTTPEEIRQAAREIIDRVRQFLPEEQDEAVVLADAQAVRLTQYTHGLGCACKLRPQDLEAVLRTIPVLSDPKVLVGPETADDAAVYRIQDDLALVQTVDFFTPVVDDPYQFGAIAATNALSDIYAMGARPAFALNIVGFPAKRLPMEVLSAILRGASDKAAEAGIAVLGGHTVEDNEPKFGMVVTGFVHPDQIWKNEGACTGDILVLTKPIGLGIMTTALKRGLLNEQQVREISRLMTTLNRDIAEQIRDFDIHACTDVTGFGLLGHLLEMVRASRVETEIWMDQIPVIEGVESLIAGGVVPGGTKNNLAFVQGAVNFDEQISTASRFLLADAQTSGGLLFSVAPSQFAAILLRCEEAGLLVHVIGTVTDQGSGCIRVKAQKPKDTTK